MKMKRIHRLIIIMLLASSVSALAQTAIGRWRLGEQDVFPEYVTNTNNGTAAGSYTYNTANANAYPLTKDAPSGITFSNDVPSASLQNLPGGSSTVSMSFSYGETGNYGGFAVGVWGNTYNGGSMTNVINNFAFEAWIKPANTGTNVNGLARQVVGIGRQNNGVQIVQNGSNFEMRFGSTVETDKVTFANISTTEWTHVAVAVGGTTNYTNFYVNGSLVGQVSTLGGVTAENETSQYFGVGEQCAQYGGQNFIGLIDEVRLFTFDSGTFSTSMLNYTAVPESSTYAALAGIAALGLAFWRRRKAG